MKIIKTGQTTWTNRHETFTEDINDLYELGNELNQDALETYNDATQGFMKLIADAILSNTPIRSLGAGWSWTKIATVKNGVMLDTKPLNSRFNITAASLRPDYSGDAANLLFVQSGISIQEIDDFLLPKGKALKTHGASNGQTIAGAIATVVHGSVFDFGAMPEFVTGLHIIVGPNRHIYLERASAPVVSETFVGRIGAEHVLDDELFNAALVSFGSFGIIHGVMIQAEDSYLLETYMQRLPYDSSLKNAMATLDFSNAQLPHAAERPYHFSVLLNPYDMDKGAYVTTMYKRPYSNSYPKPKTNDSGIGPGDDAPTFIGLVTDSIPAIVPQMVNKVLGASLTPSELDAQGKPIAQFGTIGEIFTNTTLRGKLLSAAVGFPADMVNKVADLMLQANKDIGPFAGLFSFRFVKQTSATMGFTRFPYTCVMELDGAYSPKAFDYYSKTWKLLEDNNIPFTFHWGKFSELNPQRIKNMYGADADAWITARKGLLDKDAIKVFTNPTIEEWGLS
ncbi:MAG: FAD-binding protein [Mucilaginibacter sp.]|nr:FAD-binding protein [Mucilaginibacter sp.]